MKLKFNNMSLEDKLSYLFDELIDVKNVAEEAKGEAEDAHELARDVDSKIDDLSEELIEKIERIMA